MIRLCRKLAELHDSAREDWSDCVWSVLQPSPHAAARATGSLFPPKVPDAAQSPTWTEMRFPPEAQESQRGDPLGGEAAAAACPPVLEKPSDTWSIGQFRPERQTHAGP